MAVKAFPDGFLWGASTAAYQIEGAVAADGRGPSIWDTFSGEPGRVLHGDTGEIACDHYNRLDQDLDLLRDLGAKVYRFSIAWPRIQPAGRGPANLAGLAFYDRLIDGLLAREIMPVPTLYHWDLPQALQDEGGWASRAIVAHFADYAEIVFDAFGDRVRTWTTVNEPWVAAYFGYRIGIHAPGLSDPVAAASAHHHMLLAHAAAVDRFRDKGRMGEVGIALNLMYIYPASDHPQDRAAAEIADAQLNGAFLQPLFAEGYPEALLRVDDPWRRGDVIRAGDLDALRGRTDFLSVNFYHPRHVCAPGRVAAARAAGFDGGRPSPLSFGLPFVDVEPGGADKTLMGWIVEPRGLRDLLVRLARDLPSTPLYISENGAAFADYRDPTGAVRDDERIAYLHAHLAACAEAIADGVDLRGYWVWSLLDNFEWAMGYSRRFGIVHVDYPTQVRTPKASFDWYRRAILANALPECAFLSKDRAND